MHTMTQGTQSISKAHRAALGCLAVARQLSVVVMMVSIVALLAGTAGTSYAKQKKTTPEDRATEDTVVVTNFGSLFAGSIETFAAGSILTSGPIRQVRGSHTLLGAGNGASGDAQSSLDGDIAVTIPLGIPGLCPSGCVGVWPFDANGNAGPENLVGGPACNFTAIPSPTLPFCSRTGPLGIPILDNNTGLFLDQGVAFENPFRVLEVVHNTASPQSILTTDRYAVANFGQVVIGSLADEEFCGDAPADGPDEDDEFTLGTITIFNTDDTGNVTPTPDFLTLEVPFPPAAPTPFWSFSSIGGCDTALAGPLGVTFDNFGNLWVVNELGKFVTEYEAGDVGDAEPINIVGLPPITGPNAIFVDPAYITVGTNPFDLSGDQVIYVTDVGDNSIKVLDVNVPFVDNLLGTIVGGHTKLARPEGIVLLGDDLYVVNNNANSLAEFDDLATSGLGNIFPTVLVKSKASKMNFPVGVAAPQFFPPVSVRN
jgi:hypothetical protein